MMEEEIEIRYYKFVAEMTKGTKIQYIEFTDGWATRQAEKYVDKDDWLLYDSKKGIKDKIWMCDQHVSMLKNCAENIIEPSEFLGIWEKANTLGEITY